jgi:hypothetical protein
MLLFAIGSFVARAALLAKATLHHAAYSEVLTRWVDHLSGSERNASRGGIGLFNVLPLDEGIGTIVRTEMGQPFSLVCRRMC